MYVAIAVCSVIATSVMGSFFTKQGTNDKSWYDQITHPELTPPKIVFPIVWTALYILLAIAFYQALQMKNTQLIAVYAVNMLLNVLWCYVFFSLKNVRLALAVLCILWASTALIIWVQRAWILVPYIAWLTYAMVLNGYAVKAKSVKESL
jgi:translocator protein